MTVNDPRPELATMLAARLAPGFREWPGDLERRVGRIPMKEGEEGRLIECHAGGRVFVGLPDTPGFEAWRERQRRREEREKQEAAQPGRGGPA